jgi:nucleotide-binding universal stress UspA family protein
MFRSCLICTDLTDGLHRLINFVPALASGGLEKIIFFHSVPLWEEGEVPRIDEEKVQTANIQLAAAFKEVPQGVEVKVEVLSGNPLETIPRILSKHSIDVILTGTPIRSYLEEKCFGSTSIGLAKITQKPLTIIRPQLITTYTSEELNLRCQHLWRYLLIPYNDSPSARYLIQQIKQCVQNRSENSLQKCMLISVIEEGGRRAILKDYHLQEAREKLNLVKRELEQVGLQVNVEVREGNPLQEINQAALNFDLSAIAIATDYRNSLMQWTVPSFANDLMRSSWFPVLLFPQKK